MKKDYTIKKLGQLFEQDKKLFDSMKGHYVSINEQEFFENLQYKQEYEPTGMNDLILHEDDNEEGIYIVREGFGEYHVGYVRNHKIIQEKHVMMLSEALDINLFDMGAISGNLTLLGWLRARDYKGIQYDHNLDKLY